MIDILEQIELNGFARTIGRLNAVDHDTAHAADEVAIEKRNRGTQAGVQLGLPVSPIVPIQIAAGDAAAVVIEDVEIVSRRIAEKAFQVHLSLGVYRRQPPIE